jgi:hypothetical protein
MTEEEWLASNQLRELLAFLRDENGDAIRIRLEPWR